MKIKDAKALADAKQKAQEPIFPGSMRITVGTASCGIAKGAEKTLQALKAGITSKKISARVVAVGCNGLCHKEPIVEVHIPGKAKIVYGPVTEKDVPALLQAIVKDELYKDRALLSVTAEDHVLEGTISYGEAPTAPGVTPIKEHSYYRLQHKVILRNAGSIDPESIHEYIARGGYAALAKALKIKPADIAEEISKSGLRGRGGGGFPVGIKWKSCMDAKSDKKYLICNVSEGEPGIGMHRSFLESDPHSVIEGLIIGAYTLGAQEAYVYMRDNYRLALARLCKVADATEAGLLGENILGSALNFTIKIKEGGGRFVCGEETSLIACIEGRIGEPRQRPPFPTVAGLFDKPTCINNIETWANVPVIIMKGSDWYRSIGSSSTKGTKVLSLAGDVACPGMIEVTMGTSLKDVIFSIGGGVVQGKALKAIQTGGPSGGVLPANMINRTVDYDDLKAAGSLLGSGGMIIMGEDTDMVKIARYFTEFFTTESCGKCTPCREGMCRMCDMLDEIIAGQGTEQYLTYLEKMSIPITEASACALGKTAPVPILSTLQHFRNDYMAYIKKSA
jgi:NADH:ubiquinone oxidoreductase subunit F (NADH-binding)/(2Fe-2S) ferredoxin